MKFRQFLLMDEDKHPDIAELEFQVAELEGILEKELKLSRVLQCSAQGCVVCNSCRCLVPLQVRILLAELAMVEEEIIYLERRVDALRTSLHHEKMNSECFREQQQNQGLHQQQKHFLCGLGAWRDLPPLTPPTCGDEGQAEESEVIQVLFSPEDHRFSLAQREIIMDSPNKLSEELIRVLITIYHKLNGTMDVLESQRYISRTTLGKILTNSKVIAAHFKSRTCSEDSTVIKRVTVDGMPYKNFVQFTRYSYDKSRLSLCSSEISLLRILVMRLCSVDLAYLTNKQKLAFWINIYNACIMHAFLQHGLPPPAHKVFEILNQAAANVGGIVLNALAIEHFILRHSSGTKDGFRDRMGGPLTKIYGLGYPEPNVTFALCRGTRSSPPLRVYTAEDVVNELEQAKVEFLGASIRVGSKKTIVIPRMLHWHMRDFADDTTALLEWIHSQLPRSELLKPAVKEVLNRGSKKPVHRTVEIDPYDAEFQYLLPL